MVPAGRSTDGRREHSHEFRRVESWVAPGCPGAFCWPCPEGRFQANNSGMRGEFPSSILPSTENLRKITRVRSEGETHMHPEYSSLWSRVCSLSTEPDFYKHVLGLG